MYGYTNSEIPFYLAGTPRFQTISFVDPKSNLLLTLRDRFCRQIRVTLLRYYYSTAPM
jgi:hypothetical protein